jgi:hypothetical protein
MRELGPVLAAVGGLEKRRILNASIDSVGIGQRRLEVPDAFEFPRMRGAVVPLVRARNSVIGELVADCFPGFATVAAPLHRLAEPVVRLRCVDSVRIDWRRLQVIELPAAELRFADIPLLALAIGRQDKRAFARANQHSHPIHRLLLRKSVASLMSRSSCNAIHFWPIGISARAGVAASVAD